MSRDLADLLRDAIKRSGLSASELAMKTGVHQTLISRFLRGKDMGIERAGKIAAYLNLTLRRDKPERTS
jgi:transcriptional regulator with XRE-family HTH domain